VSADDLRWLTILEEHGLIERLHATSEMSREIVTLSATAFDQMTRLLQEHLERPN
jgi:hypothetical protein